MCVLLNKGYSTMGTKLFQCLLIVLGVFYLLQSAQSTEVHYYDFIVKETNLTKLCDTKSTVVVNGSFPGPAIRVRKGDIAFVNVYNEGPYGITIHWHGVKQPRIPWYDGPEYVTQCPIEPGTNFTYEVHFTTEEGTLFWHAHSDWTRATVHGAIIIQPALDTTYPFPKPDDEQVLVFASWYKQDVMYLMSEALREGGLTQLSDAYCINGQPGDFYDCSNETTFRLSVDHGKTYLLRIVNSVENSDIFFSIANHTLTVVGWDASYVKPLNTSYILIAPGQTMDVLVTANQPLGHYYMIACPYFDGQADDFDKSISSAIFQYNGQYTPTSKPYYPLTSPGFYDIEAGKHFIRGLRSLNSPEHPIDVPMNITTRMYIALEITMMRCPNNSCEGPDGNRLASAMNNITFANPSLDILQAYYKNISGSYQTDFPDRPPTLFNFTSDDLLSDNVTISELATKVKVLNYNDTVEIVFQGTNVMNSGENHPMHLHGYRFYVIGMGVGNFDKKTDPLTYNLVDPPEANTIPIPKDGWATIRFRANNPGVWFMHCHFDRHMTWGMDTTFIVKNGKTRETSMADPPAYMPPCGKNSLMTLLQSLNQQDG